jgi:hypothetical protein
MNDPEPIDAQTVAWTPGPALALAPEVGAARAALEDAGRALLAIPDDRLEAVWSWPGHTSEVDVRYGFYRAFERLEVARGAALAALAAAGVSRPDGARMGSAATIARWSLHGLLLPLGDGDLDRDPGNGEWPIRETLGHMLSSQRSYGRFTAWWLTQAPTPAAIPADALSDELPSREEEAAGGFADVRARLDALLDLGMARFGGLSAAQLAVPARWSGGEVTVGFRVGRWASHMREHTIQVEKTLVMLDRPTTEVERLVRLIFEAYGRLEETVFGIDAADARPAAPILSAAVADVTALVPGILGASEGSVAPPSEG